MRGRIDHPRRFGRGTTRRSARRTAGAVDRRLRPRERPRAHAALHEARCQASAPCPRGPADARGGGRALDGEEAREALSGPGVDADRPRGRAPCGGRPRRPRRRRPGLARGPRRGLRRRDAGVRVDDGAVRHLGRLPGGPCEAGQGWRHRDHRADPVFSHDGGGPRDPPGPGPSGRGAKRVSGRSGFHFACTTRPSSASSVPFSRPLRSP